LDQSKSDVAGAANTNLYRDNSSSLALRDNEFVWNGHNEYETISEDSINDSTHTLPSDSGFMTSSFAHQAATGARANSVFQGEAPTPPLVSLRPASSTDAWFILNLLSAVPFLSR
jgi:hypothetical protein